MTAFFRKSIVIVFEQEQIVWRDIEGVEMNKRSYALADRIEQGALALEAFASSLTDQEWQIRVPGDGRKIGVVVHHVASMYPIEIQVAQTVAAGKPVEGVTWDVVDRINARTRRRQRLYYKTANFGVTPTQQRCGRGRRASTNGRGVGPGYARFPQR